MASLGLPIRNDPLYPDIVDVRADDFGAPLQLLAYDLAFDDPLTGRHRRFVSGRRLTGDGGW
jgi:tRNA pseudouridine32 synthase/23S rRNA pseudouridine746 synthase